MAERLLDSQITELKGNLAAGRLEGKPNRDPVTSDKRTALEEELEQLKAAREEARLADPVYQAQQAAKWLARYKKGLDKSLEFWNKRLAEANLGKLPAKRKPTPVDEEIRKKKWKIEQVKRESQAAIEEIERQQRGPGAKVLGFVGDVIDLSTMVMTGLEHSGVFRQGFAYTVGYPLQAGPALAKSVHAAFSRAADFSHNDNLSKRKNSRDYEGNLASTVSDGPLSQREELMRSRIVSWMARLEHPALTPLRGLAEGLLGSERAFRTFLNTMGADMYDNMKRSVENTRPGTWVEDDVKFFSAASNTLRGRPYVPYADALRYMFWAPRWVWSGVQLFTTLPFGAFARGVDIRHPSTVWKGDYATRKAIALVYVRGSVGAASYWMLMHYIYSLLAGDDEEFKPKYEKDMRSTKYGRRQVGEVTFETSRGLTQFATLGARIVTGQTKTASGEIVDIRGEDKVYGHDDVRDSLHRYMDYKLSNLAGGVMDFMAGETSIGEELSENLIVRAGQVAGKRMLPMSHVDIWEAEKELNIPQGTVAALEIFFGQSASTYGPRTKYREAKPEKRKELFGKALEKVEWDSPPLAYHEMLTPEQVEKFDDEKLSDKQEVVYEAMREPPEMKTWDKKEEVWKNNYGSKETFQKAWDKMISDKKSLDEMGITHLAAQELLWEQYHKPDPNNPKIVRELGNRIHNYKDRAERLWLHYGKTYDDWQPFFATAAQERSDARAARKAAKEAAKKTKT